MRASLAFAAAAAAVAAVLAAPAAHAAVLVSNLAEPVRATTIVTEELWASQEFINDGSAWTLTSIRTVVGVETGAPDIFAELRGGGITGAVLTTFALPSFAGPVSVRTFTPNSAVTLDPNGSYWFVLGLSGQGQLGWSYAEGNGQVGSGSFGSYAYSTDQGATWPLSDAANPYLMEVNVQAVPEPGAWALMILGFGLAGAVMRGRRALVA